ncbi:UPF0721 transmembrane protein [Planctomycetota bacterium]|nr:UPF0721 transmembrane protein [Planctomycetota bacterium]
MPTDPQSQNLLVAILLLLVALLYSSVGQAGASGYLAIMALAGIASEVMKPTALALNLLVGSIALVQFLRVGGFSGRIFVPLAVASIPFAYVGGRLSLPAEIYQPLVGSALVFAAWQSFRSAASAPLDPVRPPGAAVLMLVGGVVGFLSGLTGMGGGVLLGPLLLHFGWASGRVVAGVSAAFILVNSISGILGVVSAATPFHPDLGFWAASVAVGGLVGASWGSRYLKGQSFQRIAAVLLLLAGAKMITSILPYAARTP